LSGWRLVRERIRHSIAPAYLLACIVLGGSAQGAWQNMLLQLAGIAILAWAAAAPAAEPLPRRAGSLLFIVAAALLVVLLQLIPLPPSVWAHGSRTLIADGYQLLGQPLPMLPISLTPAASVATLLCLIPPVALFCAMTRLRAYHPSWIAGALLLGTLGGVSLGALQVADRGAGSPWYLYPESNFGSAVGFFANSNHMATLLLMALPFVAAIASAGKGRNIQGYFALLAVLAALTFVLIVGLALNGSLAGYGLAIPVVAASVLVLVPGNSRWRLPIAALAALALIGAVGALATTSIGATKIGTNAGASVQSRQQILDTTGKAIADTMPWGSGLGSFVRVYPLYESPQRVTNEYVIHAHNDYVEVALELGLASILLMLAFLLWWGIAAAAAWRAVPPAPFGRAAAIASAAVLVHSLVDFPLRTAAISACFAACCALLADRRAPVKQDPTDLWPTRHLVIH
jgi:O-antigen ligase